VALLLLAGACSTAGVDGPTTDTGVVEEPRPYHPGFVALPVDECQEYTSLEQIAAASVDVSQCVPVVLALGSSDGTTSEMKLMSREVNVAELESAASAAGQSPLVPDWGDTEMVTDYIVRSDRPVFFPRHGFGPGADTAIAFSQMGMYGHGTLLMSSTSAGYSAFESLATG
jgi:hypothetical protein